MNCFIVALTGGIGSGKTTVSNFFFKLGGVQIIDTDIISKKILNNNYFIVNKIIKKIGIHIVKKNNKINRKKLRKIIFNNIKIKTWLDNILHPEIYKVVIKKIKKTKYIFCIVVIPLLIESNYYKYMYVDKILVVDVPKKIQIERTVLRDKESINNIKKIIAMQIKRKKRLIIADNIINNNCSYKKLFLQVKKLHFLYYNLAIKKLFF